VIYRVIDSPVGGLRLAKDDAGLRAIEFIAPADVPIVGAACRRPVDPLDEVVSQLEEYFEGKRRAFDLPLAPQGTPFQQRVWRALLDIPYGETISYGELASRIGNKAASRAVGLANGSNPLPIVIPCHRVIGSNGKLTGYGGGLPIKQQLLSLERGSLLSKGGGLS
jgi:methylated-DNA-[protein]-cysteine S-methyltransferase